MDPGFLQKLTAVMMSYGAEGLDSFKAVAVGAVETGKTGGWAYAMRRLTEGTYYYKVAIVLCREDTSKEAFYTHESEWVRSLRTAIRQAMRGHDIEPDVRDRQSHPLLPHLLRCWSGMGTGELSRH